MNEKRLKRRNLALRIIIFIATYTGVNAVRGFFRMKTSVDVLGDYEVLALSASLAMDYMVFLILSIAAFVMNFVARKSVTRNQLIIRSIVLGAALILIWYSAPSISYITYMGASRYTEINLIYPVDMDYVTSYISGNLWTVFSYMAAAAVYVGMTVVSIYSLINTKKKNLNL
ncbi:MAG: hypothetical protein PHW47_08565 [Lachnospira sp.]|nr:hypothetical protein [Lachnospira sp.]